jgi:hypothetical protein
MTRLFTAKARRPQSFSLRGSRLCGLYGDHTRHQVYWLHSTTTGGCANPIFEYSKRASYDYRQFAERIYNWLVAMGIE